ncbi:MAG: peptide ABC transporter substrate-binding protein [bacterium]
MPKPQKPSSEKGTGQQSVVEEEPVYGGIYQFPLDTEPPTLDPAKVTDTVSDKVIRSIFSGLVKINPKGQYVPAVAEKWSVNEDGTEWIFTIRDNVFFHNGRKVTAGDFAYSFRRILDPATASPRTWVLDKILGAKEFMAGKAQEIKGIEVPDDRTLKITLAEPFAPFLGLMAMSSSYVVPSEVVEKFGAEFATRPETTVGSGPFILRNWDHNNYLLLEGNKEYYDGRPYVDGLRYRIISEPVGRLQEFRAGNLHHTDIPPDLLPEILANESESKLMSSSPTIDVYNLGFNCQKPPFKDNPKLRQAFCHAIDRKYLINSVLNGLMDEATSIVPPLIPGYDAGLKGYEYNEGIARQLLAEAGYPDGKGLPEIVLYHDSRPPRPEICQVVKQNLARIGVNITLKQLEWASFLQVVDAGEPSFFQLTWLADYPDPENFLYVLLDSKQWGPPGNSTRYKNPEFDRLVEEAGRISDTSKRWELYAQAERIAFDDAPWLLLLFNRCTILVNGTVHGLEIGPMDRAPVLPSVAIEKVWLEPENVE